MLWRDWKAKIEALGLGDDADISLIDIDEDSAAGGEIGLRPAADPQKLMIVKREDRAVLVGRCRGRGRKRYLR
jgi:hypothetical protein